MAVALTLLAMIAPVQILARVAQASPAEGKFPGEVKLVAPMARGKKAWGAKLLTTELRRVLTENLGPLVSATALRLHQKRVHLPKSQRYKNDALAAAALAVEAQYILVVTITHTPSHSFSAHARLLDASTATVLMSFRTLYSDPGSEAADRAHRIAAKTIQKLQKISARSEIMSQPRAEIISRNRLSAPLALTPAPAEAGGVELPGAAPKLAVQPFELGGKFSGKELSSAADTSVELDRSANPSSRSGSNGQEDQEPGEPQTRVETFRFALAGGLGLVHSYDLSSAAVPESKLSYRLNPLLLIAGSAEAKLHNVPLGALFRISYRPAQFSINVQNTAATNAPLPANAAANLPKGSLINISTLIETPIVLAGEGRRVLTLVPALGAKIELLSVDPQPGNLILSSTAISPIASLGMRIPMGESIDVDIDFEGGPMVYYQESPTNSGTAVQGYTLGGGIGANIWISSVLGLALTSRLNYDHIQFTGNPTRILVSGEQLQNGSNSTQDVLTQIGLVLRL